MDNPPLTSAAANVSPLEAVNAGNAEYIDALFRQFQQDPNSVDARWAAFFAGFELAGSRPTAATNLPAATANELQVGDLIHSYRELGHLIANLDPLGHNMTHHPLLELAEFGVTEEDLPTVVATPSYAIGQAMSLGELIDRLRATYCGTLAVEYMDIRDPEQRQWIQDQIEPNFNKPQLSKDERKEILRRMIQTEEFELFLQRRFPTVKRFSNEGGDALIPLLDEITETGSSVGVDEVLYGMAHRGRLSVLAHILRKPYEMIMSEVIGRPTYKLMGDGDVKYHLGYAYDLTTKGSKKVHLSLAANPSHLEIINPVVEGMCRAKQNRKGDVNRERTIPVLIHGDAAFTGQGVVAETLYLSELEAYRTGGTLHVIINNQIGFTTNPSDGRFTRYPTDIAKAIQAPVFHVNADDPEAVVQAGRLAMQFRARFQADAIIDLVCYRRRGHNELDDASVTQPVMAREIEAHTTARHIYAKRLISEGVMSQDEHEKMTQEVRDKLAAALDYAQSVRPSDVPPPVHGPWANYAKSPRAMADWSTKTAVDKKTLKEMTAFLCHVPEGFDIHPTVAKMYKGRLDAVNNEKGIDWGGGEMLGLGSLLYEGNWIRLTGQDVARGTFSHRNAVWFDHQSGRPYVPLAGLAAERGGRFMIINSMLSELAVVGFEYGFASADPQSLVIWEAQFGDFVNMTQPMVDQFIASAESKWGKFNGLVMFLPHGYDGQGPEHSHARLERFLQLCAEDNMQVVNPTTPAQLFHMLRRQVLRPFRKPLIVMTPKSSLRNPLCVSALSEFSEGTFQHWIDETEANIEKSRVRRVLMCSGKVYYDLLAERTKRKITDVAIVRLEQIYPFDSERLSEISKTYPKDVELMWVQEEPRNNGVYPFIGAKLHYHWQGMKKLVYIGRKPSASPAAGTHDQHVQELADILGRALGVSTTPKEIREAKPMELKGDAKVDLKPAEPQPVRVPEVAASKEGK